MGIAARRSWPGWANISAAIGSIAVGLAFSRVAAGSDFKMEAFLIVAVSLGLFIVTSGLAGQFRRVVAFRTTRRRLILTFGSDVGAFVWGGSDSGA
jgi:hypothetical protein